MPKKLSKEIDYSGEYIMVAVVSNLKDYSLCFHINGSLNMDLVKYDDMYFDLASDPEKSFSWYYFTEKCTGTTFYLLGNKSEGSMLLSSHKTVDYFLLIKDYVSEDVSKNIITLLRKIPYITTSYNVNIQDVKLIEPLLETIELHELEVLRS